MRTSLATLIALAALCLPAHAETLEQALVLAYQKNPSLEAARGSCVRPTKKFPSRVAASRPSVDATAPRGSDFSEPSFTGGHRQRGMGGGIRAALAFRVTQPLFPLSHLCRGGVSRKIGAGRAGQSACF